MSGAEKTTSTGGAATGTTTTTTTGGAGGFGHRPAHFLREHLGTVAVLLVLVVIGFVGYRTEWKLSGFSALWGSGRGADEAGGSEDQAAAAVQVVSPKSPDKSCPLNQTRIEFPSAEAIREAGLHVATAVRQPLTATVTVPGEVDYDPNRVARLSSPVPGRVWRVDAEVGDRVRKGDVLALVDSADVGKAKADFLQALTQLDLQIKTLDRLRAAGGAVAGSKILEAQASVRDARIRLFNTEQALMNLGLPIRGKDVEQLSEEQLTARVRFLGLPESLVQNLDPEMATSNLYPAKAPFDGIVAERNVAPGEVVDATKVLFVVADLRQVWIILSVPQEKVDQLRLDQPATFEPDGHPGEPISGKISWISTVVDERTRTMRVRAVVDNPKEHVRPGMFGVARITIRDAPQAVVVPGAAVQREGDCEFVFVRLSEQAFQLRQVSVGVTTEGSTEIRDGLRPGEVVVTTGSFILKSQILKGRLGEPD